MDGWIPSRIKGHLLSKFRLYSAHHQDGLFRLQVEENQWIPPSLLNFFCSLGLAHRFLLVHHPSDSLDQKGRTHLLPLPPSTRYSDVDQTESLIELKTKEITIPDSMPKSIRSLASSCKAYLRDLVSCTDGPFNENDIFLNDKKIHFRKTYTEIGCDTKVLEAISQTAKNCQASLNSWDFKTQASKKDGKDPSSLEFRLRFLDANFNSSTTPKLHDWVLECLTIALDSIKLGMRNLTPCADLNED